MPAPAGDWGQFSRDGRTLLYGDDAGRTWLYDTRTWRPRGRPLAGHTGPVLTVNLSPDGQTLATTSTDGTTRLWDVASHRPIGTALPGIANHNVAAAFVDGGNHLVTVYDNGRATAGTRIPPMGQTACDIAGRTLTPAEGPPCRTARTPRHADADTLADLPAAGGGPSSIEDPGFHGREAEVIRVRAVAEQGTTAKRLSRANSPRPDASIMPVVGPRDHGSRYRLHG